PSERAALPFFVASGAVLVPPGGGGVPSGPAMVLIRNRPDGGPARDAGRRSAAGDGGSRDHTLGFQGIVDLTLDGGDRALRLDRGRRGQCVGDDDRHVLVGGGDRPDARGLQRGQHLLGEGVLLHERRVVV